MRVLVTGSRTWEATAVVYSVLDIIAKEAAAVGDTEMVVVHGACPQGADRIADGWVRNNSAPLPVRAERHPAIWRHEGRSAGFKRNERMVKAGADVCLAFIRSRSSGATHCANLAEREGITVRRFES
jgi:hypothetical protein